MIDTSKDTVAYLLKENFNLILSSSEKSDDTEVITEFFGVVNQELIQKLTDDMEGRLFESGEAKSTIKKIFAVFIEAVQNIYNHGSQSDDGNKVGVCIIQKKATAFELTFMNLMETNSIPKIKTYLDKLNGMNLAEIKELYMETLSNGLLSEKGGAGLGYMTIRLKSQNPINFQFTDPIGSLCGFQYSATVERKL